MTGQIRLFDKINGLLVEVPPAEADMRREGHLISRVSLEIDVLWTPEEEAARDAEEAAAEMDRQAQEAADATRKANARAKLDAMGITESDIRALLS